MKARPDVRSVVHCHPPHATAFAVAHEPIPKCVLPEFEVFLGEVAISPYETPGSQKFADTVLPYVKDTETILLANHGTVTYGTDLEDAYFKTEIIDAYCRILLLAKQLGRVNYYDDAKAAELIKLKPNLGIPDPRLDPRPRELRPLRQQPLPRGLRRLQARAQGVHPSQALERPADGAGGPASAVAAGRAARHSTVVQRPRRRTRHRRPGQDDHRPGHARPERCGRVDVGQALSGRLT